MDGEYNDGPRSVLITFQKGECMGNRRDMAEGSVSATGSALSIICGFKPKAVSVINVTNKVELFWTDPMGNGTGWKKTGKSALNLATPVFSGTGTTAAGQVITTTDNQTMTLNQCAGMWLIQATGATPPNLILSNTAVTGAPAVLTVQGSANTDAGTYKIVQNTSGTGAVQLSTLGITPIFNGFTIGADTDLNLVLSTLHWTAWK
jgi:hypothetical protein